ncbi:histone acetyltransferase KAT7 [Acrasis kona]|uniref:Histone acetyltransferase KAT7 n=1 Tax=Acrasis kona TaxID=1008807 RepID=A0AAW2ZNZ8_9EUKA
MGGKRTSLKHQNGQLEIDHSIIIMSEHGLTLQVPTNKTHQRIRSADFRINNSLTLSPSDENGYKQAQSFDELLKLNIDFLKGNRRTSPFTTQLEDETRPCTEQLIEINKLGLLTVCSSAGISIENNEQEIEFQRASLQGLVYGELRKEVLENLINQTDLICFYRACSVGFDDETDDDRTPNEFIMDINSIQIPIVYKFDHHLRRHVIEECVTCFNWISFLKTSVQAPFYYKLSHECYNIYIIDPKPRREANDLNGGLLNKIINVLKQSNDYKW